MLELQGVCSSTENLGYEIMGRDCEGVPLHKAIPLKLGEMASFSSSQISTKITRYIKNRNIQSNNKSPETNPKEIQARQRLENIVLNLLNDQNKKGDRQVNKISTTI